jgi:hypothetical protein
VENVALENAALENSVVVSVKVQAAKSAVANETVKGTYWVEGRDRGPPPPPHRSSLALHHLFAVFLLRFTGSGKGTLDDSSGKG